MRDSDKMPAIISDYLKESQFEVLLPVIVCPGHVVLTRASSTTSPARKRLC